MLKLRASRALRSPMPEHQTDAIHAVARLMSATVAGARPEVVHETLAREARDLLRVQAAVLVELGDHDEPVLSQLSELHRPSARAGGDAARALADSLGAPTQTGVALAVALRGHGAADHALVLFDGPGRAFTPEEVELAEAFAAAAGASLAHLQVAEEQATRASQQAALARAAKT